MWQAKLCSDKAGGPEENKDDGDKSNHWWSVDGKFDFGKGQFKNK